MTNDFKVAIIGGGLSGASTAYHLSKHIDDILLIEAGKIGKGSDDMISGTLGPNKPVYSKMITTSFESDYETFKNYGHEFDGAKTFLELTHAGTKLQKSIASSFGDDIVRELGTVIVGYGRQLGWLYHEHNYHKILGFGEDYEEYGIEDIIELYGNKKTAFQGGLFIPEDAIIAQELYVNLLRINSKIDILAKDKKVSNVEDIKNGVKIKVPGEEVTADYAVIATNGFYNDKNLSSLLDMYWSFIVSYEDPGKNTPNAWNFADDYHYWTRQDNILMIGGDDRKVINNNTRYSNEEQEALNDLKKWANEKFPNTKGKTPTTHFGIFAYTKDEVPIVGRFNENSRIFYIVGCNGMGQSTLSYGASLMPGLLGYEKMNEEQKKFAEFLSPTRKTLVK